MKDKKIMTKKNFLEILNPHPSIGGIEINEAEIKFAIIKNDDFFSISIPLASGIIEKGLIKDKENFGKALQELRSKIESKKKKQIYTVVSIPDINVYTQVFNLPNVADNAIDEAATLNLQMISPIDFKGAYSDWQKIGEVTTGSANQLEILGAFIQKQIIDDYTECFEKEHIMVVAFEFASLGISRICDAYLKDKNQIGKSALVIRVNGGGITFTVVRKNNLYFHHYEEWPTEQISVVLFKSTLVREAQKVFNFYSSHWEDSLETVLVAGPNAAFEDLVLGTIKEEFKIEGTRFQFPEKYFGLSSSSNSKLSALPSDWVAVLGAAVRGQLSRSKDTIISLASTGTEQAFFEQQIIDFSKFWRNIVLSVFSVIFISFAITYFYFGQNVKALSARVANLSLLPEAQEMNDLQDRAGKFNREIQGVLTAKNQIIFWSPLLKRINEFAGNNITIDRITVQSADLPILINARAQNEQSVLSFKNILSAQKDFSEINLPIANVSQTFGNMVKFNVSFKVANLSKKPAANQ